MIGHDMERLAEVPLAKVGLTTNAAFSFAAIIKFSHVVKHFFAPNMSEHVMKFFMQIHCSKIDIEGLIGNCPQWICAFPPPVTPPAPAARRQNTRVERQKTDCLPVPFCAGDTWRREY